MDVFSNDHVTLIVQQLGAPAKQGKETHMLITTSAVFSRPSGYMAQTMKEISTILNFLEPPSSPTGQTWGLSLHPATPLHL